MVMPQQVFWIIRDEMGILQGPIDTEAVLRLIREGQLTGGEMISQYPQGQWSLLSRRPEFYDILIEALEGAVRSDNRQTRKEMTEETIFMPPPPSSEPLKSKAPAVIAPTSPDPLPMPAQSLPKAPAAEAIELKKISILKGFAILEGSKTPLVLLGLGVLLLFYVLFTSNGESAGDRVSLVAPGKASAPLSESEVRSRYLAILGHIERDTFEDYLQAQNKLVPLLEGAPANLEIRSVLCFVYKELWPFTAQAAGDQKVVSSFAQSTRVMDVTSPFGSFCESVKLLTSGRFREARGAIDNLLEKNDGFSMRPVVYTVKGEILENDKDYMIAARYFEKASQDWEKWVKPRVRMGFTYLNQREYPKAADTFRSALSLNSSHKGAQIGLAFAEYYGFRQYDNALKTLGTALNSSARIARPLEGEAWQVYAELLIDRGQKREALKAAEKAFQMNPNNESARQLILRLGGSDRIKADSNQNNELILLGDQYVRQGDCLSAQAEFKAAFEVDNKNATAALKAAKCLWQLNQSYEAIEWLNKAIRADQKLVSAYVLQSDYLSQRYDFTAAAQSLNNAARLVPNNHEVLRGMALLEFRKNNMNGAINYALRSVKIYDADIETYILLAKANLAMALSIHSSVKKDLDRRENAIRDTIRYATKAIELDATNPEAQMAYARMLSATNGTESAVEYLREMIRRYAYSFEYRLALADIYREVERWSDARAVYEQVVEASPRNKAAWIGLGEALRATGFNEQGLKAFLNATVIDPTDGEALFQAGKLYFETSRFEDAFQLFQRVKSMNANFPRSNYYAGRAAFALGRFDEALRFAREEKSLNPNLSDTYLLTGEIYSAQGAFSECASEYAQAIKLRPASAEIYVKSAECYRKSGSLEIAETMLTLAKERESGYAGLYRELGALFEKKGDAAAARQSYRNYLELAPNAPDKNDIEVRISRLGG